MIQWLHITFGDCAIIAALVLTVATFCAIGFIINALFNTDSEAFDND